MYIYIYILYIYKVYIYIHYIYGVSGVLVDFQTYTRDRFKKILMCRVNQYGAMALFAPVVDCLRRMTKNYHNSFM